MASNSTSLRLETWLANPQRLFGVALVFVVLVAWAGWTYWSEAHWFYQLLFLGLMVTGLILVVKPAWFLGFLLLLLIGDVTSVVRDAVQIPGFVGLPGLGGKAKIPELLSALAVLHLAYFYLTNPHEFRKPLVGRAAVFIAAGMIGTLLGLRHHYSPTSVMRDSLAYYFCIFYIMGMVTFETPRAASRMFRLFFYITLLTLLFYYGLVVKTHLTGHLYAASSNMLYSICAYFLIAKLFTSPPGTRKWLTVLGIMIFSCAMFIGRSRTGVLAFMVGLIPIVWVMRPRAKFQLLAGFVVPCIFVMLTLFAIEAQRHPTAPDAFDPGARGLEAFTQMGDAEHDPTGNYRLVMWKQAFFDGFLRSPILGKGYGWTMPVLIAAGELVEYPAAVIHNSYLHVLACGGLVGFIPLVVFICGFFGLCANQIYRAKTYTKRVFTGCALAMGLNFFLSAVTSVGFEIATSAIVGWLLLAIAVRLALTSEEELEQLIPRREGLGSI